MLVCLILESNQAKGAKGESIGIAGLIRESLAARDLFQMSRGGLHSPAESFFT